MLPSPGERARVLTCRAMGSVCRAQGPSDLGFFYQRFSLPIATKPVSSETRKAERWSGANHGSMGDSWPIAFSGCPRGPRVGCETRSPRPPCLTYQLRLALEPECLQNPTTTARRRSPGWSGLGRRHSSCLWFQIVGVEAHSLLPDVQGDRRNLARQC